MDSTIMAMGDGNSLETVLPFDVLEMIMGKLGSEDLISCANTSKALRKASSTNFKLELAIFEEAMKIALPKIWKDFGEDGFPLKQLMLLRLLSSRHQTVIDRLLVYWYQNRNQNKQPEFSSVKVSKILINEFSNYSDSVFKFLNFFENTHFFGGRSPLIGQSLYLTIFNDDSSNKKSARESNLEGIFIMLQKFGRYIRHLDYRQDGYPTTVQLIRNFRKCLLQMPRINSIECTLGSACLEEEDFHQLLLDVFPDLHYIRSASFKLVPKLLVHHLVERMQNLTVLNISFYLKGLNLFELNLPNLKELKLKNIESAKILEDIKKSPYNWKLQGLKLGFENNTEPVSLAVLIETIQEKFGQAIASLSLKLPKATTEKSIYELALESTTVRVDLPFLKNVKLALHNPTSIDFLLGSANSIEYIYLDYHVSLNHSTVQPNPTDVSSIKFNGTLKNDNLLATSNVWEFFSKLHTIKVKRFSGYDYEIKEIKRQK